MTRTAGNQQVVTVKPQPNIYTVLIAVAIVALAVTVGFCLWKLMSAAPTGYGLEFGQLFSPTEAVPK